MYSNCIFLPHNRGVPLSSFPKGTTIELVDFVFTLSFMLSAKQEAVNTNFLKYLVQPDLESNSRSTASIKSANLRSKVSKIALAMFVVRKCSTPMCENVSI